LAIARVGESEEERLQHDGYPGPSALGHHVGAHSLLIGGQSVIGVIGQQQLDHRRAAPHRIVGVPHERRRRRAGATIDGRVFLVGGGSRSEAYRRRLADLSGRVVAVPDTDETVATGAAVQAAVVVGGDSLERIAERWGLGSGSVVEPLVDASSRRTRWAMVRDGAPMNGTSRLAG